MNVGVAKESIEDTNDMELRVQLLCESRGLSSLQSSKKHCSHIVEEMEQVFRVFLEGHMRHILCGQHPLDECILHVHNTLEVAPVGLLPDWGLGGLIFTVRLIPLLFRALAVPINNG
jgi:hypothetical protein